MADIGIDFGSTYSTVSLYNRKRGIPEALEMAEGDSTSVPSVVAYRRKNTYIGNAAKNMAAEQTNGRFSAFKMMLTEEDPERLKARGFTDAHSPTAVTKDFLEALLKATLERIDMPQIDHLVVGAPEIWNEKLSTVDGRAKLRDICKSLSCIGENTKVQIVSEPVAASAYFAHNFAVTKKKPFSGDILLVDYGGGTLDITLTNVELRPDKNGNQNTEVKILYRTGAGENEEQGNVGRAGIIYMETLTRKAILEKLPDTPVPTDSAFFEAVDQVEAVLKNNTELIADIFDEYGDDPKRLSRERMKQDYSFSKFLYHETAVPLTFRQLAETYREVIYQVFDEKLSEVMGYMDREGISYKARNDDSFKIALVGGFGNFDLVKKQLDAKFQIGASDRRCDGIMGTQGREKAVSLGAALISGDVIRIRNTAPFSIGVACKQKEHYTMTYGIRYGQDIEFDIEYPQCIGNERELVVALDGIQEFLINSHADERKTLPVPPKQIFLERIREKICTPPFSFGFSLDSSGIITLHVHEYDVINDKYRASYKIELSNFKELFETERIPKEKLKLIQQSVQYWEAVRRRK